MSNKDLSEIVQELKSAICASEARILLKIENYNERIKTLEDENTGLKRTIEKLERNSKKNNLVIFGLNLKSEEVSVQNICNKLNTILETNLNTSVISDLYLLGGNTGKEPIKLELLSRFTKVEILSKCKKLKGTNIIITPDLTKLQQERNKILRKHLKEIRNSSSDRCYIKGEKLYRNNKVYTVEDILAIEEPNQFSQGPSDSPTLIDSRSASSQSIVTEQIAENNKDESSDQIIQKEVDIPKKTEKLKGSKPTTEPKLNVKINKGTRSGSVSK